MAAHNLQLKRKTASAFENVYVSTKWELVDDKPSWITPNKPSYTWSEIGGKPSLVDTTSNQSIDGVKTFAKKISINYQTAEQIELMASSGKVVLRTSSGQLMMMNNGDSSWGAVLNNNNLGYYTKTVFGKSLVGTSGNIELEVDDVPTLPYTKISGLGSLALKSSLSSSDIPSLDAGKITTGTFAAARIPNLDAGKITSGTLGTARIPGLDASKITTGTFNTARIPTLAISKISGLQTALDAKMEKASFSLSGTTLTITV